ncbi:zinc finger and SCAN domain-containing protein 26 [Armigeres subalbatus]|uniref:zinc finger and SCAN domain-containing protein 26 n=1 Tax=Armigeres subalbatus TaxID=124917 RepID=UPI002ED333AC
MASSQIQVRPPMGLLTTVADLPPSFKAQYVPTVTVAAIAKLTAESPLDLTVKQCFGGAITPPLTPSPLKKRYRDENDENHDGNRVKQIKVEQTELDTKEATPVKPVKNGAAPKSSKNPPPMVPISKERRTKAARKLKFDEETTSPVSGTIIISLEEAINGDMPRESGDIDPQFNLVEISDEVRAELATIPNVIGAYNCKLCRLEFEDAFGLAQHRCACIVLLEYRCPECSKRFNCPANLASHRRWHKPRDQVAKKGDGGEKPDNGECKYRCEQCNKTFKRPAYLKKHQLTHNKAKNKSKHNQSSAETETNATIITASASYRSSSGEESNHSTNSSNTVYVNRMTEAPQTVFTVVASEPPLQPELVHHNYHITTATGGMFQSQPSTTEPSEMGEDDDEDDDYEERALVINEDYQMDQDMEMDHIRSAYCNRFTEEENIAAAALAHLRNGPSVIRHTTALVV